MSWSRPGPGRPFGTVAFAEWRGFASPAELKRVWEIEAKLKEQKHGKGPDKISAAEKLEYATIRNRAVKRHAWLRKAG